MRYFLTAMQNGIYDGGKAPQDKISYTKVKCDNRFTFYNSYAFVDAQYTDSFPAESWIVTDSNKELQGYTLQQAKISYGGRDWIAWFAAEVSSSEGPYVFSGLPGLILEVYDTNAIHTFCYKGKLDDQLTKQDLLIEQKNSYRKLSRKKYLKLQQEIANNYHYYQQTFTPIPFPADTSPEGIKQKNAKELRNFHPIEID